MTAGFYKIRDNQMFYAPNFVEGHGYILLAQDKNNYEYPIDGWYWFDSDSNESLLNINNENKALYDKASAVFDSLSKGKQALWEPVRVAVGKAILMGDMQLAYEILTTMPNIYEDSENDRQLFLSLFS